MKRKGSYATVDVEKFDVDLVIRLLTLTCIVAIDVAKTKFVAALATASGEVVKLVRFEHPRQTLVFLRLLKALRDGGCSPQVVMEPTGTYGDAVRQKIHDLGVGVYMMPPKHTHDFAEVFDGVPSMHDPKAASVLAKLHAVKPAKLWVPETEARRDLRAWVDQRDALSKTVSLYQGHLEALLARHWPEFGELVDVHTQRSWFALIKAYPGPQAVAASEEAAKDVLWKSGRGRLGHEHIEAIVDSARSTTGVDMTESEKARLRAIAEQIEHATRRQDVVDDQIAAQVEADEVMRRLASVVGPACAAAMIAHMGSPLDYPSATALEKAMGLNLKEHSSGKKTEGQIGITKRGPGQVRQLLYMATLRLLSNAIIRAWYCGRTAHKGGLKLKAVIAVMRKIARALWHVARGAEFDATKLFDVRRLDLEKAAPVRRPFQPASAAKLDAAAQQKVSRPLQPATIATRDVAGKGGAATA